MLVPIYRLSPDTVGTTLAEPCNVTPSAESGGVSHPTVVHFLQNKGPLP